MNRLPIRGGNWNNGSNAGLAALNLNNTRTNANNNIGFRPLFISPDRVILRNTRRAFLKRMH